MVSASDSRGSCSPLYLVISAHRRNVIISSQITTSVKCVKTQEGKKRKKHRWQGKSQLTSASPPPSSVASCPAGPLSRRAPPRRPSGPTGPTSDPLFPASPHRAAAAAAAAGGPRQEEQERLRLCCSGGRGWDNPGE